MSRLTIATRQSRLALWQAQHVQAMLERAGHEVHILGMLTQGDRMLGTAPLPAEGKNLFVKELETALVDGRADLAVHSLKDMPAILPEGLVLACVPARDDPRDAWISPRYASIAELPAGATVGTASLRRAVWLRALRPDLRVAPLRGNLDSRLHKLDEGAFDGIVLSACGLQRLGMHERIRAVFGTDTLLPSPGQGALGIEVDAQRQDVLDAVAPLACATTRLAVEAERAISRTLESGCSTPIAAHATVEGNTLTLEAGWGDPSGRLGILRLQRKATLPDPMPHAIPDPTPGLTPGLIPCITPNTTPDAMHCHCVSPSNLRAARELGETTARVLRTDARNLGAQLGHS